MTNRLASALVALGLLIAAGNSCFGAADSSYRTSMSVPPAKIYENMLKFAGAKQFDNVKSLSIPLRPVLASIKEKYSVDLENDLHAALATQDDKKVSSAILKMVYWDLSDIFSLLQEEMGGPAAQSWFKTSLIDYYLLVPSINGKNTASNDKIVQLFKSIATELEKPTPARSTVQQNIKDIQGECLAVFPEFAK